MPNYIANVTVPAPVIQFKNDLYLTEGQYDPRTLNIPCGINALVWETPIWCVPVRDSGICTTCSFVPATGDYPPGTPPTPDSLLTLRISDKYNRSYWWYVICSKEEYYASCQTCCGSAFIEIPPPVLPIIVPCQTLCENNSGIVSGIYGYPVDAGNYHAYGEFEGESLPKQTSATIDGLVILLNAFWTSLGSPGTNFVWSASNGILTALGGQNGQSLCVLITSDNSP